MTQPLHHWLLLLVDILAVYRLTRLITEDVITLPIRDRVRNRLTLHEFLTCPWCVSPWLAALLLACQHLAPTVTNFIALALALSAVAGLISERA
jgi:hypothetical protein